MSMPLRNVRIVCKLLLGENFRRRHDAGLVAVVDGYEHRHQCYEGFAGSNIALQQAVHLSSGSHVGANLVHDALLCSGELEVEVVGVEPVELLSDVLEDITAVFAPVVAGVAEDVELDIEELLKLQTHLGTAHVVGGLGVVDEADGVVAADEVQALGDEVGRVSLRGVLILAKRVFVRRSMLREVSPAFFIFSVVV